MTPETELLDAIYASPDEDGPRVVYADYLLAKGDPRGELIQVQCRLADPHIGESEHRKLRAVENKLLAAHGGAWTAPVLDVVGQPSAVQMFTPTKVEFRRGFVDSVRGASIILEQIESLFAVAPLVTKLRLDPTPPYDQPTQIKGSSLVSPHLAKLEELQLFLPGAGEEAAELIAACPHFTNLKSLTLAISRWDMVVEGGALTARGARALARSPHLAKLEKLILDDNRLGDDGVVALTEEPHWRLVELSLAGNLVTDEGVRAIAGAASSEHLRRLNLARAQMKPATAGVLASSKHLDALEELNLEDVNLKAKGAKALLDALSLKSLRHLSLESTGLGDEGIGVVARSPKLRQLRVLNIRKNGIGKKAMAELARSENLCELEKILAYDRESKEAREAFLSSPYLANAEIYFRGKLLSRAAKEGAKAKADDAAKKTRRKKSEGK